MIFVPGPVITVLTFPGVVVHEAAHLFFCRLFGVPVFDVCFFRFGNPAGYVAHRRPESFTPAFFVCLAPFLVNSLLCVLFCLPAVVPLFELEVRDPIASVFAWLGVSIGMHAFPSRPDLANLWELARPAARAGHPLAILGYPLIGVLQLANFGRFVWLDLLWGMGLGGFVPLALLRFFA